MAVERIGRYEIIDTLGRGAMGVVYLALDPIIDRQLALKTLRVDLDDAYAAEFRERFLREAKAAGRLNHPGIVTIHDVGEDPETGLVFIAMEFIEGRDLKQLVAAGHRFRPSEAARIAADVAQALDYAHSMGVVHRDVKPANIILTHDGSAKITDFGIAHLESSNLTVDGQFIGTPNFMSPEQITGKQVDGRSDIFSLGVVLFTLLTGRRPFAGETMHEVTMKVVGEPPPIPSTLVPEMPPAFNPVILKCLEKDPEKRFQTGNQLARVLAALARSLVDREPGDAASTGVFQPDLATRAQPAEPPQPRRRSSLRDFTSPRRDDGSRRSKSMDRMPLPEVLKRDVNPAWVRIIVGGGALLLLTTLAALAVQRDTGPFIAPSDASIRNLHVVAGNLVEAERRLRLGHLGDAHAATTAALDQVPASPAARRLMREVGYRLEQERTSAETQQRVAELVAKGREEFRRGRYRTAAARFEEALEEDPENELAASYLDLARERQGRGRSAPLRRPTPVTRSVGAGPVTRAAPPTPRPTLGTARITVYFNSPISAGEITITLNDVVLASVPFDFSKKGFLGIKRGGSGSVKRVLLAPEGRHNVGVTLHDGQRRLVGSASFQQSFEAGSDWSVRIDLPSAHAEANFYLVKTSR